MTARERLEYAVVGDFLGDAVSVGDVRRFALAYGLESKHFKNAALGAAFDTAMSFEGEDKVNLVHEIAKRLSGEQCNTALDSAALLALDCEAHIHRLVDDYVIERIDSILLEAKKVFAGTSPSPEAYAEFCREQLDNAMRKRPGARRRNSRTAKEFIESYDPEEEDRKRLFKGNQGRWLAKEGALLLTSTAGAGKSVLAMQMGLSWACGKPWLGIVPAHPLKVGIFQTEDDNETMYRNMLDCQKAGKWSDQDFDVATTNFVMNDTEGLMGDNFIKLLATAQREDKYDLVIVNPLQGVCGGTDIARNAELTKFLREGLDSVIKGRARGCPPCGLVLVHHTNKPIITPNGYGVGAPQFLEYAGAGGAELANWMRAMLLVLEDSGKNAKPGHYRIIAAKKGDWLDWPMPVGESIKRPMKHIRHHDPDLDGGGRLMFWYEVDAAPPAAKPAAAVPSVEEDAAALAAAIAKMVRPPTLTEAREKSIKLFANKRRGNMAYKLMADNPAKFGLQFRLGETPSQKLVFPVAKA